MIELPIDFAIIAALPVEREALVRRLAKGQTLAKEISEDVDRLDKSIGNDP